MYGRGPGRALSLPLPLPLPLLARAYLLQWFVALLRLACFHLDFFCSAANFSFFSHKLLSFGFLPSFFACFELCFILIRKHFGLFWSVHFISFCFPFLSPAFGLIRKFCSLGRNFSDHHEDAFLFRWQIINNRREDFYICRLIRISCPRHACQWLERLPAPGPAHKQESQLLNWLIKQACVGLPLVT